MKTKKCTKKRDARAELFFCSLNLLFLTFPLLSSSWFRKVPNGIYGRDTFSIRPQMYQRVENSRVEVYEIVRDING